MRTMSIMLLIACALAAHAGEGTFRDNLGKDQDIGKRLSSDELDAAFDLKHHLRHVGTIFERVFR